MESRWDKIRRWLGGEGLSQLFFGAFCLALLFTLLGSEDFGRRINRFFNDRLIYDFYARFAPVQSHVSQKILIVDLEQAGGMTDRHRLARAVERCLAAGAAAVGVDILILGPAPEDEELLPGDEELLRVFEQDPARVILASNLRIPTLFPPYTRIPGVRIGFANFIGDNQDQTLREVQLWHGSKRHKEAFCALLLTAAGLNERLKDVPTDGQGRLRLLFPRAPQLIFPVIKVEKLLNAPLNQLKFTGQIVLLGNVTGNLSATDLRLTPVGPLPGLFLHAIALENLMQGTFPRTLSELVAPWVGSADLAHFLIVTVLLFFLALFFRQRGRTLTYVLIASFLVAIFVAGYVAYTRWYLMLPVTAINFGVLVMGLSRLRCLRVEQTQTLDRLQAQYQDDISKLNEQLKILEVELNELGLFEPLRNLEQGLRRLCAEVFRRNYGEDWEKKVLAQMQAWGAQEHPRPYSEKKLKFWKKERQRLRAEYPKEPITFLNATQLSDFKTIFEDFREEFVFLFPSPTDFNLFMRELDDIREARNLVAHHNRVPESLKKRVLHHCDEITELIKAKNRELHQEMPWSRP